MDRGNELDIIKKALLEDERAVKMALAMLTPREEEIMRMRLGLWKLGQQMRPIEIAEDLGVSYQHVVGLERRARKKLRHPSFLGVLLNVIWAPTIELSEPLAGIKRVSPDLMQHLKREHADIVKVPARVFEEIVAELLAGMGWKEVRLVGRSSETSADILAGHFLPDGVAPIRVFIEVKRWKDKIGVEVFNQVLGAMVSERERFGWHQAWIVTLGGVADTRKFSRYEWRSKGLEVKEKEDLLSWLDGYRPNRDGLWLPPDVLDKTKI
jgi:DNA-binding CsgD family transcriptional regulator